ncbi:Rho guanine nucleotide exchange factor, putative [Hondaea fermentalgiana]|uniref:Rho guanine nucleotide exchange factor, putative n=1 Tax=Hondaea fermentalgiana TaxID=2315210 RepID=A0A2R5GTV8_9STRA|nr:Rho guanine nucleotide exchange factor, putative [Hondaea fermentalgiana]|eukprot:GBG31324.1 Rho guanine nucleotide exchange factor, putative [Hondaea fermentalgiana]
MTGKLNISHDAGLVIETNSKASFRPAGQIIELLQQEDDLHDDDGHALWKGRAIIGENLERETRCDKLFRAIEEVIETELRHVSDLSIVLEVFIMPFQDTFGPLLARQVFSDWAPLLRVHEQVLVNLMATLPSLEQLAKGFESVGNDPNVQLALRDDTNQGPAKQPRGARVGLAPSNLAAFAEGVNQAARLGVARKPLGADSGTPSASIKSTAQQRGKDFLSAKDMNAMKERLAFLSKLRREHLADFLYLDDAQVTRWTLILHEMTISVCRVMTEMSDWLKLCIPCVVNQPVAMKTLLRSKGGNGATVSPKMFIQLQAHQERERLKHLDLASFLIKPMQRITKYPLLMREIRKYCEADSKAQSDASDATETMTRIATNVNDIMKQHQNLDYSKRLIEICTQLRPRETVERLGLGADSRGRRLYRFGRVTFQTLTTSMNSSQLTHEDDSHLPAAQLSKTEEIRHGSCYAMLFTSALLLSLKALNKWKTKTKFHIVKVVELGHIVSVESMDGCLAVRTACSLLLITPLEGDVLEWLVDMQECRRVAAADRERQDVVNAQRKKRQGSSGRAMTRRTRSEDLSKLVRGPLQSLRGAPSRELTKAERDNIICELKTHAKFSTAS